VLTTAGGGGLPAAIILMIDSTLIPAITAIKPSTARIITIMRLVVLGFSSTRVCMRGSPAVRVDVSGRAHSDVGVIFFKAAAELFGGVQMWRARRRWRRA